MTAKTAASASRQEHARTADRAQRRALRRAARRALRQRMALRLRRLLAALAVAWAGAHGGAAFAQGGAPLPAGTLPQGGQVVVGSGQIQQKAGNLLQITQGSARLGIDWQSFSVGSGATVEFVQPSSSAIALNRVLGNDPSQIFGRLRANGQVFLTNPNGVLFAPGAQVDVGGLVASALDLSQQDFASGNFRFSGHGSGSVVNQGRISAAPGGYVALFGRQAANDGEISVPTGSVVLASGRAATVAIAGGGLISAAVTPGEAGSVTNSGSITADGGSVRLTAQSAEGLAASLVNNSGIVRANTLVERAGEVWLTGNSVANSGRVQADATDAAGSGNAGRINLLGDAQQGSVSVGGTLSASAAGSGSGGAVETSAAQVHVAPEARVSTLAASGRHGQWTIDPTDFTVTAGGAAQTASGIGADTLAANLAAGNVSIAAATSGTDPGDITVAAPVAWAKNTTLTLTAPRNIQFNANVTASGRIDEAGNTGLALNTGSGGVALADGVSLTLGGNAPTFSRNGTAYTVVRSLAALQAIDTSNTTRAGRYVLGSDIDASASAAMNSGQGFDPIGSATASSGCVNVFCGELDGLGHAINGLTINRTSGGLVGMFGGAFNATVRNLALQGGAVVGRDSVGALIGWAGGNTLVSNVRSDVPVTQPTTGVTAGHIGGLVGQFTGTGRIEHVRASGTVTAQGYSSDAGGVAGTMENSTRLDDAVAIAPVSAAGSGRNSRAGGLVGRFTGSTIVNGRATGSVSSDHLAGGLVGDFNPGTDSNLTGSLSGSSSSSSVSGTSAGGLVGTASSGDIQSSHATGSVSGGSSAGGLVGQFNSSGTIADSSASGDVSGRNEVGGLVGAINYGRISGSTASGRVLATSDSSVYAGGLVGAMYVPCSGNDCAAPVVSGSHALGDVLADASGGFTGGLVGLMYYGSIVNSTAAGRVAATDSVNNGSGPYYNGGLVGYFGYYGAGASISNSSSTGAVSGRGYVGGLVGYFNGSSITDSQAHGAITGDASVGGLLGGAQITGLLSNVSATGAVTARSGANVGGLGGDVTLNGGSVTSAFASGDVTATTNGGYAGGLFGSLAISNSTGNNFVDDAHASGRVSGGSIAGGLVGYYNSYYGRGTVLNSSASGAVGSASYAGGLIGYFYNVGAGASALALSNSSASGDVTGTNYVGGLVGVAQTRGSIVDTWATGTVTGLGSSTLYLGGLIGYYHANHASVSQNAAIVGSYASGQVRLGDGALANSQPSVSAGGLVGLLDGTLAAVSIRDSYASGGVVLSSTRGRLQAGGLVGQLNSGQGIDFSYATGTVQATGGLTRVAGGLVAVRASGTVTNSFWDRSTTGQTTSVGGGTGLTSAQMLQASSFTGWADRLASDGRHTTTWRIYEGLGSPLLTRLLTPLTLTLADATKVYDGSSSLGGLALTGADGRAVSRPERLLLNVPAADVGSYAVAASNLYSAQNGYDLTVSGSATLTVNPRPVTLAGVVADKVYDGTRTATLRANAQPTGLVAGEDLRVDTAAVSAVFDTKDVGQNKAVTLSGLALADGSRGKASNYVLANADTAQASISQAPLTAGGFSAVNRVYDGSTAVVVNVTPAASVTGRFGNDEVAVDLSVVTSGRIADKNVGQARAVTVLGAGLTGADAGNYRIAGIDDVRVDITPRPLSLNGLVASDRTYNRTVNVTVSLNSATLGGVVAGDAVALPTGNVTGTMADKNAGTGKTVTVANVQLRGADEANYTVQSGTTTVDIARYSTPMYVSRTNRTDRIYDGTANADVSLSLSYYGGDDITVTANPATYSDKNVAFNGSGQPTSKTITVTGGVLSGADASNYVLSDTTGTTSGTITPKALTVNGVSATNRAYDGTRNVSVNVAGATVDASAIVAGDTVSVNLPGTGTVTGLAADKNVGNAKPVAVPGFSLSGTDAANYTLGGTGGVTVNITRKDLTAVYVGLDKVYDNNPYAAISVSSPDIVAGDTVRFYADEGYCGLCGYGVFATAGSTPGHVTQSRDAGTGKLVVVTTNGMYGADAGNYNLVNVTGTTSASITPKPITPVFAGVNKVYDGTATARVTLNTGASGIYSSDAVNLSSTAVFAGVDGKNVGTAKRIDVSDVAFSGAAAGNYTLSTTTASTTANITPKPVTVTGIAGVNRAYDGTTTVALAVNGTPGAGGIVGNDVVTVALPTGGLSTGTVASKNVGTAKPVTVTGLTLAGTDAGNYQLDGSSGVVVDIAQRALTVGYTGVDRVYNGGVSAQVTASAPNLVSGDAVSFSQTAIFSGLDGRNVGNAKPIAVSNIALAGTDAANYALQNTTASASASITQKPITVAYSGIDRVYNGLGDTSAVVTGSSSALVAGDAVGFSQDAVFRGDGAAGTGKIVDVSRIALNGAQAGNYTLTGTTATTTASILRKPIGVTGIRATDRTYDGTTTVALTVGTLGVDTNARVGSDEVSVVVPAGGISTGTMANKFAGSNKSVDVTGLGLSGAQAANYTVSGAAGLTVNIVPKALTATYSAADKVYDGSVEAQVSATLADVLVADRGAVGVAASGLFADGKNVGTGKSVTVSNGFLTGAERNNYALANTSGSATASITQRTLTPAYVGGSRVYDGGTAAPVTAAVAGIVTGDSLDFTQTAVFSGDGARNAGNRKPVAVSDIALGGADSGNYRLSATTATTTASITPKPLHVEGLTGVTAVDRVYDGTRSVAVNMAGSGPLVAGSSDIVAGDVVAINIPTSGLTTGTMTDKHVGQAKAVTVDGLTLSGSEAGNYTIVGTTGVSVNIAARPLTAAYTGVSKVYDGTTTATLAGTSADILAGDSLRIGGGGVYTGDGARTVGEGKAIQVLTGSLSGTDARDYALQNPTGSALGSITPRPLALSFAGGTRVYDGTTAAPVTASIGNLVAGDAVAVHETAQFTGANAKNVGTGKAIQVSGITVDGADSGNYLLTASTATTTGDITPRPIVVQGFSAAATDRVYDGTRTVAVQVTGTTSAGARPGDILDGDRVTLSLPAPGTTTGTMADRNVGQDKAVVVTGLGLSGADAANYAVAGADGVTVNITPRTLTAAYSGVAKVYDGTAAAQVTGTSGDLVAGDVLAIGGSGVFTAGKNVGSAKTITVQTAALSGPDAGNYALSNPGGTATGDITPRTVSASFAGGSKVYDGGTAAPVTGSVGGLVAGDTVTLSQTAAFTGPGAKNVATAKPVAVSGIALGGSDAGNYVLASDTASTTASITPKPLTVDGLSVSAVDRVYDGTRNVALSLLGASGAGLHAADIITGDDVALQLPSTGTGSSSGSVVDKHAGLAKAVTVSGLGLTGADAGNYSIGAASGVTVNIAPRPITAQYSAADKVYDGTAAAQVSAASADVLTGDTVAIGANGIFSAGKAAGTAKAVAVSGGVLSGVDAGDYTLGNPTGSATASITPKPLTVAFTGGTRVYDGGVAAPVTVDPLSGIVAGDSITVGQTAVFTGPGARNVGTAKPVAVSDIVLAGGDAGNYSLQATTAATTASVTPRPVNVSGLSGLSAVDRAYDGTRTVELRGTAALSAASSADILAGDDARVALSGPTSAGTLPDKHAGTGRPVAVDGLTLSGADAGNYAITGAVGLTVNIAPLAVAVAGLTAVDRVYDGGTAVAIDSRQGRLTGTLAGDDVALRTSGITGAMADKAVGTAKPVTLTGTALAGADAADYAVGSTGDLRVSIAPRTLQASYQGVSRVFDGSTAAQVTGSATAIVANDAVTIAGSGVFTAGPDAGTGKAIAVQTAGLSGADAANYRLDNPSGSAVADIRPRPVQVTVNDLRRFADDTTPVTLSFSTDAGGLVGSDRIGNVQLPVPVGAEASRAGAELALAPSGATVVIGNPGNYELHYVPGVLTVQAKPPRTTDGSNGGNTGDQFAIVVDQAEVQRALDEVQRNSPLMAPRSPSANLDAARRDAMRRLLALPVADAPTLSALVQGDPRRITLTALLQFPLLSYDPQLQRLYFGTAQPAAR